MLPKQWICVRKRSLPALGTLITLLITLLLTLPALASSQMSPATRTLQQDRQSTGFVYQGFLSTGSGGNTTPANGSYDFQFSLFSQIEGAANQVGSTISRSGIPVQDGMFSVQLNFGSDAFGADTRYLDIRVRPSSGGDFKTLSPRQQILSVPYAVWADKVPWEGILDKPDDLGGTASYTAGRGIIIAGDEISVDPTVIQNRITGECAIGTSIRVVNANGSVICQQSGSGGGSTPYVIGPGLVLDNSTNTLSVSFAGSGTAAEAARSDHHHAGAVWNTNGDFGLQVSTSAVSGIGIWGEATANTPAAVARVAVGVYGEGDPSNGRGVEGFASSTTGNNIGTAGFTDSPDGFGVYGRNQSTAAPSDDFVDLGVGVYGRSDAPGGSGLFGLASAPTDVSDGVWGITLSPDGAGVRGSNDGGGKAGIFEGDVDVQGNLTKSSGSFKIDHPLDPTNKYLYHSFVESPDMMNIYNGNVILDETGAGWVQMPDWFEALNMEFRYQLTPIGAPGPNLYIAQEISGNRFQIGGGTSGMKVSWQVTGIRNDAYARAHRIPVEEEKPQAERGSYLHPQEFGQPEQRTRPAFSPLSQSSNSITTTVPIE